MKRYLDKIFFEKPISYQSKIIGILLVTAGIAFFCNPTILFMKIGMTLILIGVITFFMILEESVTKRISEVQIVLILIVWILLVFFITRVGSLELFFSLTSLGILIIKDIADEFVSDPFKKRLNVFVFVFVIIFIAIVIKSIINILGI